MRKLDIFTHIWPKKFHELLLKQTGQMKDMHRRSEAVPMMTNLDRRFEVMDMFDEYQQIFSLASPPPDVRWARARRGASFRAWAATAWLSCVRNIRTVFRASSRRWRCAIRKARWKRLAAR